jgi:hypothetical protein
VDEENGTEETTYSHKCSSCQHDIATHTHTFTQTKLWQESEMDCLLCGTGESQSRMFSKEEEEEEEHEHGRTMEASVGNGDDLASVMEAQTAQALLRAVERKSEVDGLLLGMGLMATAVSNAKSAAAAAATNGTYDVDDGEWEE